MIGTRLKTKKHSSDTYTFINEYLLMIYIMYVRY